MPSKMFMNFFLQSKIKSGFWWKHSTNDLHIVYLNWLQKVEGRGLHGSQNSYPNTKRPVKYAARNQPMTHILFESGTQTRADPRNALNVLPGPNADPTIIRKLDPNPAGKTQTRLHPKKNLAYTVNLVAFSLTACDAILFANKFPSMLGCSSLLPTEIAFLIHYSSFKSHKLQNTHKVPTDTDHWQVRCSPIDSDITHNVKQTRDPK